MKAIQTGFTSCSREFLLSLKNLLTILHGTGGSLVKRKGTNAFCLKYSIHDSLLLYDLMYGNLQTDLFLERKKRVYEGFMEKLTI